MVIEEEDRKASFGNLNGGVPSVISNSNGDVSEELVKKNGISTCAKIDEVSWLSFVSFSWIFGFLWNAYRGRIDHDRSWTCSIFDSSNVNMSRLEHLWNEELKTRPDSPSLFRVVFRFMKVRLIISCIIFLFCLIFGFIGPTCLIRGLISFTENPPLQNGSIVYSYGMILVFSILVVEVLRVLMYGATWAVSYRTGIRVRGALLALLYKNLINAKSLRNKTPSEVVNIYANDGQRIFDAVNFAPLVLVGPFVLVGGMIYLLKVIGPLSLLGVGVFFVFDVFQAILGMTMVRCRNLAIEQTEGRMNLMGEIIKCIRVIKMNAWEELFIKRVIDTREKEKRYLRIAGYAQSLAVASGAIVPVVATFVTVLGVVLSGDDLLASDAFSAITVFFVMLFGIRMIPYGTRYLAESRSAIRKIQELLLFPKYDANIPAPTNPNIAISMKSATFTWDCAPEVKSPTSSANGDAVKLAGNNSSSVMEELPLTDATESAKFALYNLNFIVEKKQLIGICGTVGSGKSALLNAILGHLSGEDGELAISGNTAFVGQHAFVMNGTVRDNILFGLPMNTQRYYKAITAAQLTKDLECMPANELSEIGEHGATLSGGQKMRISIARALYSNRDIYLLDDIFASVDKRVADRIFESALKEMLSNKTVLLVTASEEYLKQCDKVLFIDQGEMLGFDEHDNLLKNSDLYKNFFTAIRRKLSNENLQDTDTSITDLSNGIGQKNLNGIAKTTANGNGIPNGNGIVAANEAKKITKLVNEEEDYGLANISRKIYLEYINAAGGAVMWAFVIFCFIVNVGSAIFSTYWLSKWMKDVHNDTRKDEGVTSNVQHESMAQNENLSYYTTIYAVAMIFLFVSGLFKAMVFVKVSLTASTNLHNRMLQHVVHAVTWFFDSTPSGRILNRFSKDLDEIDVKLPFSAEALLQCMITCLGFLAMIAWVFPVFLVTCIPLFFVFSLFFLCFRAGIRSLKRTENISRSPVFEQVSFSLDGLATIHSYGQTARYIDSLKGHLDENSGAIFMFQSAMRWQAVWLDLLVVAITSIVSLLIVFLVSTVSPSEAGMAIAFAMQMSGVFQFAVRSQTEVESKLTAVERISYYYKNVEQEPITEDPIDLPANWPATGDIKFNDVVLRYHKDSEPALKGASFEVQSGEKVGIVGRTGSGKSSLCSALFRMYPLESGSILVASRDIFHISLSRVRRAMAIIPQDPVLFTGTLRFNVDPENKFSDAEIWECIDIAGLRETVSGFAGKLELKLEENGRNLSSGERQLICMVRALLRKVKIVVLDEATANVDLKTDVQLQNAIRQTFTDQTVLLVTHRLNNVSDVDRIFNVENGQVTIRELKSREQSKASDENSETESRKNAEERAEELIGTRETLHNNSAKTNELKEEENMLEKSNEIREGADK